MSEMRITVDLVDWLSDVYGRTDLMRDMTLAMVDQYEFFACAAQQVDADLADLSGDVSLTELVDLAKTSVSNLAKSQLLLLDAIKDIWSRAQAEKEGDVS